MDGEDGAGGYDARPFAVVATETSPLALRLCMLDADGESRPCALPDPRSEADPCARVGEELCDRCPWPRTPNCCIMKGAAGGRRGMSA